LFHYHRRIWQIWLCPLPYADFDRCSSASQLLSIAHRRAYDIFPRQQSLALLRRWLLNAAFAVILSLNCSFLYSDESAEVVMVMMRISAALMDGHNSIVPRPTKNEATTLKLEGIVE
jgi:hypothetical protein